MTYAILGASYLIGFCFTLWANRQMPVTDGLAVARSFLWPIWLTTGWPKGEPMQMD